MKNVSLSIIRDSNDTNHLLILFWILFAVHFFFWTFFSPLILPNYRIDTIEMMVLGQNGIISSYKHPCFPGWVVEFFGQLFHRAAFVPYFAAQCSVFLSIWGILKFGQKYLSQWLAILCALCLMSYSYFNYESTLYNNRTFLHCFWILSLLFLFQAFETNCRRDWILTGLFLTLGIYSKLTMFLLVLSILVFMIINPQARSFWKKTGPYLTTGTCFLLCFPLLVWLWGSQFSNIEYACGSLSNQQSGHWYQPLVHSLYFLFSQFPVILPILIPLLPILGKRWTKKTWIKNDFKRQFLTFFIFFPLLIQLLIPFLSGGKMRTALGSHLWFFLPIYLLYLFQVSSDTRKIKMSFRLGTILVAVWMIFYSTGMYFAPAISGKGSREQYPGREVAEQVENIWKNEVGDGLPLPFVRGDNWISGCVCVYGKDRPNVWSDLWSTEDEFLEKGGVLLWSLPTPPNIVPKDGLSGWYGNEGFFYVPETGCPSEDWFNKFPDACFKTELTISKKTPFDVPPARIGLAVIPPRQRSEQSEYSKFLDK